MAALAAALVAGLGSAAVPATSVAASPPSVAAHPTDTVNGSCALPFMTQASPTAAWKQDAAPLTRAATGAKAGPATTPTADSGPLPRVRNARRASTSHVVSGPASNTPTTGYALRATAPSVATGGAIKGTVTGPGATPLAGIYVLAYNDSSTYFDITAADGSYAVGVSAGSFAVYFFDPEAAHPAGYYSSSGFTPDEHQATPVTVTSSDVTGISVQLPAPIWITGTVTGPGGIPLEGIDVGAYSDAYNNGGTSVTAADGSYAIALAPGTYTVGFDDMDGVYASGYYASSGFTADPSAATPVVVTAADVAGIDVQLPLSIVISGRVTGPGGVPVADIMVSADGQHYGNVSSTEADGSYSIAVVADSYRVSFYDPAGKYPFGYYSSAGFTADQSKATLVKVTTSSVPNINVSLPTPIYIKGKVTGPGSTPLADINVTVASDTYYNFATTAADGTYAVSVIAGSYVVAFDDSAGSYASGYYGSSGFTADPDAAAPVKVTTATVSGINVQLPLALHITGTVTGPGDVPLAGVEVSAYGNLFGNGAVTGDDGGYSVVVSPGTYHVEFDDPSGTYVSGYYASSGFTTDANAASPVVVTTADATGIDVTLPAPIFIRGTVTGPGGIPLADIVVDATSAAYSGGTSTAEDGSYAISVVAGSYHVAFCDDSGVYGPGYYSASGLTTDPNAASPVTLTTADVTGIDVELPLATHLSGAVTGPGGAPLADIGVWVWSSNYEQDTFTDADGTYSVVVVPGTYIVAFYDPTYTYVDGFYASAGFTTDSNAASPVPVAADDVTGIDVQMPLTLPPTATITALPVWAATASISLHWGSTDGSYPVTSYDVRVRRAAWNGTFGAYTTWKSDSDLTSATYAGKTGSTYCFGVRARDINGMTSAWTADTCTAVPLDDRSLTRSTGWTSGTGSSYYKSTYLKTTKSGVKLTRTGVVAKKIGIVATSCSGCGTIRVYWGSKLLRTISLNATKTTNKKLFYVTTFSSFKKGTLTIKVVSSGKKVLIDGVAIKRN